MEATRTRIIKIIAEKRLVFCGGGIEGIVGIGEGGFSIITSLKFLITFGEFEFVTFYASENFFINVNRSLAGWTLVIIQTYCAFTMWTFVILFICM